VLQRISDLNCLPITGAIGTVRLAPYNFIVWIGGPVLPYHAWTAGPYLTPGPRLVQITADPDQAARAPVGEAIIGDPGAALTQLAGLVATSPRPLPQALPRPRLASPPEETLPEDQVKLVLARTVPTTPPLSTKPVDDDMVGLCSD
jgi:benzoylformate decarboxylase